ncbi:MAG: hypothetical protein HY644_07680 [Acidobacteria bacterium]|nr:hypothetical protein [Acidobacteriota bacterium]
MKTRIVYPLLVSLLSIAGLRAETSGRHFIYAQYDFILTFELTAQKEAILNVVNFTDKTYYLRPQDILLTDTQDQAVKVDKIILETGNPSDPYLTSNMKILPNSFIGLVLKGGFASIQSFQSVSVQLGNQLCMLDSLSEPRFNDAAERINKMNFDSPDVREDYRVLKMEFFGRKEPILEKPK